MCGLRWCGRQLCLRNMPISGVNATPRPTAVYASDPALPRRPQDSLPSCLLGFERTRLSLASSFQLSSRTPHRAPAGSRAQSGERGRCSASPIRRQAAGIGCLVRFCVRSIARRLPSLRPSLLPSTPSASAHRGLVRALPRYYEARPSPRLFQGSVGSSPSCRGPGSVATAGQTRSPRFRCDPFVRDVAFDPGRATAPRITAPHMLPST